MTDPEPSPDRPSSRQLLLRVALAAGAVVALWLVRAPAVRLLLDFAEWVRSLGPWGPAVFVGGYVAATVALLPGWVLTVAAGVIFGLAWGTLWVFLGATVGASCAFLIARHLARGRVERALAGRPRFRAVDRAVAGQGVRTVLLLRLSPLFPFNLLNYALGLTRVRFRDYLIGCAGMLPGTFLYVYYGRAAGSLARAAAGEGREGAAGWVVLGVGLAATAVVTALITRVARRELSKEMSDA
ncbi:MAG: TVP38/TMEM64 family protein [Thermoanaerobaculia bacterium]|nr:TVP38/TMEM64 family protein [Thermoanaerobaculia bacterium]